jgi:DNA (cytosine-5)-methyltransferase 1
MAEIAAVPFNGLRVASTFSGCGGSSLGYRMAGFKVVWANEFVAAARDTYRANFPDTPIDERDIRTVSGADILRAASLQVGELDLLDGSPPCASFSTAGKRQRDWGKVKPYSDTRQRTDDLFLEFVRLVGEVRPRAFVAENVAGLVKGVGKGWFLDILAALKAQGYRVGARLLDAQWLGVPQSRQRLFFIGVRSDVGADPAFPTPRSYRYSVRDALPWIDAVEEPTGFSAIPMAPASQPAAAVQASRPVRTRVVHDTSGNRSMGDITNRPCPTITVGVHSVNSLHYRVIEGRSPPVEPDADMRRFAVGRELDRLGQGEQSGRYFQLTRAALAEPSPTITVEGKKAHAASVAHPTECRKFSIAELRRICGFPDDFALTGTYAQQWERLGRAVPPPMMAAIAEAVRDRVLAPPTREKGRIAPALDRVA